MKKDFIGCWPLNWLFLLNFSDRSADHSLYSIEQIFEMLFPKVEENNPN